MSTSAATIVRRSDQSPPPGAFRAGDTVKTQGETGIWEHRSTGDSRDFNTMQMVDRSQADTVPHRHNFEQIRYIISGDYSYGPGGRKAGAGDLIYFPESVYYGPQVYDHVEIFQFQWQGHSERGGFFFYSDLAQATIDLKASGAIFDKDKHGLCIRPDGRRQDGFEAVAEQYTGAPIVYGEPRYQHPLHVRGATFSWHPAEADGVEIKHLAYFNEYGPNVKLLKLAAGAALPARISTCEAVLSLVRGSLRYGDQQLEQYCQIYAKPCAEIERIEAVGDVEILFVGLGALDGSPMPFSEF